jgi:hypothetical protein
MFCVNCDHEYVELENDEGYCPECYKEYLLENDNYCDFHCEECNDWSFEHLVCSKGRK